MKKSQDEPVVASYTGELTIGDYKIQCAVLPDGTRVLSQRSIFRTFGGGRPGGRQWKKKSEEPDVNMPVFLTASNLKPFISQEIIEASSHPILYRTESGQIAFGIKASLLPDICEVWLHARDEKGVLTKAQLRFSTIADILSRGLARVGIDALVDEATGYQDKRTKDALSKILEQFIAQEVRKWIKTFPDEFYGQMFRLRGWSLNSEFINKRPGVVGRYTNDLVYRRLAPGVLDELRRVNPVDEKGHRKHKLFQWLSDDIGHPRLREHISAIIALMRASSNWRQFDRLVERAFPRWDETLPLPLPDEKDE